MKIQILKMNATVLSFIIDSDKNNKELVYLHMSADRYHTIESKIILSSDPDYIEWIKKQALTEGFLNERLKTGDWYKNNSSSEYLSEFVVAFAHVSEDLYQKSIQEISDRFTNKLSP